MTTPRAARFRLLVADEEFEAARFIAAALRTQADVEFEPTVGGVLARLHDGERYDLVLCDLRLKGLELFERAVREAPAVRETWVFASASADPELEKRVRATGRPLLEKPVDGDELLALIPPVVP